MNSSKLPTGEEWSGLSRIYPTAGVSDLELFTDFYGFENVRSFQRAMRKRGIYRAQRVGNWKYIHIEDLPSSTPTFRSGAPPESVIKENTVKVEYRPYPEVKLIPFPHPRTDRDEEDLVLHASDWHLDKITPDYNIDIAKARVDYLTQSLMKIINLHQPIRKLWVLDTGDTMQGENPNQGSKIGEAGHSAEIQIHDYAIPIISRMLLSLNQAVGTVEYATVPSNHGRYGKEANPKTNWQTMFVRALKLAVANQPKITIDIPDRFYQLINIRGFRFFMIHGHQVNSSQGIPLFALRRKMQEWYAMVGGFHYGLVGHFHTGASDTVNSVADYVVSPPLVTGDEWALEVIGRASIPKQLCFGVHNKYAKTFRYELQTDNKYLPKPFHEPEGVVTI